MLQTLRIKNFAIIEFLELEFDDGFNVITGETGAGKSIILDAISLLLGSRANLDVIRTGAEEALVEAVFSIKNSSKISEILSVHCVPHMDQELLIKRIIQKNGRNRIFVNGELVTLTQLAHIAENLVDLCSQHEHQSLTKSSYQLELIDSYGSLLDFRKKTKELFSELRSKQNELSQLKDQSGADKTRLEDFLSFQLQELENFDYDALTEQQLTAEKKKLQNISHLASLSGEILSTLSQGETLGVLELLQKTRKKAQKALDMDPFFKGIFDNLEKSLLHIEEAVSLLQDYGDTLLVDNTRLETVESQLSHWNQMKKKYGENIDDILASKNKIQEELNSIRFHAERSETLQAEIDKTQTRFLEAAEILSMRRKNLSKNLTASIQKELDDLRMKGTRFEICFHSNTGNPAQWGPDGFDSVEFLFVPNIGEELKPLGKIASGGELSRMMLALRRVLSDKGGVCVYFFDEIDAGIGGQTASVVGKKIASVAKQNQVICITHLAQIAAFAKTHFSVEKSVSKGRTLSRIHKLSENERIEEISRMLGGLKSSSTSKKHAKELLTIS